MEKRSRRCIAAARAANETLKDMTRKSHRSLQEQVRMLLEREAKLVRGDVLEQAGKLRNRLAGRKFSDVLEMIREDRER